MRHRARTEWRRGARARIPAKTLPQPLCPQVCSARQYANRPRRQDPLARRGRHFASAAEACKSLALSYIDIHTHLLPGIDDGPDSLDESLEMARVAAAEGAEIIVATPHQQDIERLGRDAPSRVRGLALELNNRLRSRGDEPAPAPVILVGMENHITPDLPALAQRGLAMPLNETRFILCEPPFTQDATFLPDVLFALQVQGFTPILAHPERCAAFQDRATPLAELVQRGILVQLTGSSFTGEFGSRVRKIAERFLKSGLAHMVASDMHRPRRTRTPHLGAARERVTALAGETVAADLFERIPRCVVNNEDPGVRPPEETAQPGRLRRLFGFG